MQNLGISLSFFLLFYFLSHCIFSACCLMANKDLYKERVSKYVVESAIFGIADPDLSIHYATFMGL